MPNASLARRVKRLFSTESPLANFTAPESRLLAVMATGGLPGGAFAGRGGSETVQPLAWSGLPGVSSFGSVRPLPAWVGAAAAWAVVGAAAGAVVAAAAEVGAAA